MAHTLCTTLLCPRYKLHRTAAVRVTINTIGVGYTTAALLHYFKMIRDRNESCRSSRHNRTSKLAINNY